MMKTWNMNNAERLFQHSSICKALSPAFEDSSGYFVEYRKCAINVRSVVSDGLGGHMA
jgi:hypothetical protein